MRHKNTSTDKNEIGSCLIEITKFSDGTIRPKISQTKGMFYYEVIGMLELIKIEMAEKSWAKAAEIRQQKQN